MIPSRSVYVAERSPTPRSTCPGTETFSLARGRVGSAGFVTMPSGPVWYVAVTLVPSVPWSWRVTSRREGVTVTCATCRPRPGGVEVALAPGPLVTVTGAEIEVSSSAASRLPGRLTFSIGRP